MDREDKKIYKYEKVFNNIIDAGIFLVDDDLLTIAGMDDRFCAMLGYSEEEFRQINQNSFLQCVFSPDRKILIEKISDISDNVSLNIRLMDKNATLIWYTARIFNTSKEEFGQGLYFCTLQNIMEQENVKSEFVTQSRFMELYQGSVEGGTKITYDDKKMSIAYVGNDMLSYLGYTRSEFLDISKNSFYNVIYEKDREEAREIIESWFQSGSYYEVEYRILRKDGSLVWVLDKGNKIINENGESVLVSLIVDIDNTRQIIKKLEEANNHLRSMQNSMPVCSGKVALEEEGMRIISANEQFFEYISLFCSDVRKSHFLYFNDMGLSDALINEIAIRRERIVEIEQEFRGRWYTVRAAFEDELYIEKYPIYYMLITDITEQKEAHLQALMQKEKYLMLTEISNDIIFEYDCVSDVMVFSDKYRHLFNRNPIIFNFKNQLKWNDLEPGYIDFTDVFKLSFLNEANYKSEQEVALNDNEKIRIELSAKAIFNDRGDPVKIIGILRDIEEQNKENHLYSYNLSNEVKSGDIVYPSKICVKNSEESSENTNDYRFVFNAINTMDEAGVVKALEYISEKIGVDRIVINCINNTENTYSMLYEYHAPDLMPIMGQFQDRPLSEHVVFDYSEGTVSAYYAKDIINDKQMCYFNKYGFSGIVQIPFIKDGLKFAYIEYSTVSEDKVFSENDMKAILNYSLVLSNYLENEFVRKRLISYMTSMTKIMPWGYESCIKIKLSDNSYKKFILEKNELIDIESGNDYFKNKYNEELEIILPKYKEEFSRKFSEDSLNSLSKNKDDIITCEYEIEVYGKRKWIKRTAVLTHEKFSATEYVLVFICDITENKKNEIIKQKEELLKLIEKNVAEYTYDEIIYVSLETGEVKRIYTKKDSKILCTAQEDNFFKLIPYVVDEFVHNDDKKTVLDFLKIERIKKHFLKNKTTLSNFHRRKGINGKYIWVAINLVDISEITGTPSIVFLVRTDNDYTRQMKINNKLISENVELLEGKEVATNKAKYDNLTGIYNWEEFLISSKKIIENENNVKHAIIRMDIDKFKLINDLYGYDIGDEVLKYCAGIIRRYVINHGVFGRINSDIFCMCIRYDEKEEILDVIDKISSGMVNRNEMYKISPYFGICLVDDANAEVSVLCDWANIALKKVKGNNLIRYAFYDNNMRMQLLEEIKFENEMENALRQGQFEAYLQPQYDIRDSKIIGAEALVRWIHPQEGVISPARFIPLFERNGFIVKVDEFIWREACKILRKWIDDGYTPVPISVNVSRLHIFDELLCDKLVALLNEYNLPRSLLILEVTETILYDDNEEMNRILNKLRNMGFMIAMDDFGSGYSSLNMLENMCLDELKIDRAFMTRAVMTENGKVIIKFIIQMANQLNLKVVAEGVETLEQAKLLLEFGCYTAQGYYYSRPVPINSFEEQAFDVNNKREVEAEILEIMKKKEAGN